MKSEIWLDVENFRKFEKTEQYTKIQELQKQIKLLEGQINKLTMEAIKEYNIKFTRE